MQQRLLSSPDDIAWHAASREEAAALLHSDLAGGLEAGAAKLRLAAFGPNRLQEPPRWVRARRMARQFTDLLIWLLLAAAVASAALLGAWVDALAIAGIVVINAALGYMQEARADSAVLHLRSLEAPTARIIREGRYEEIPNTEVVPGDLMVIEPGDLIAADGRVVESIRLEVAEAALTGESMPVEKSVEPVSGISGIADRRSMVHAGTTAVRGRGQAIVTATGAGTEMGKVAASVADSPPKTPLQVDLARIGRRLALVAIAAGILVFGAGLAQDYPIETMALTAVAMAVAAIPEGLPAVVTVTLAGGLRRMAQREAIVRRLPAVEALGAVDVICTDKTGTLTRGILSAARIEINGRDFAVESWIQGEVTATRLLETAALCNDARRGRRGYIGDPIEVALMRAVTEIGLDPERLRTERPRVDEGGFDSRRKRMSTLHRAENGFELHVKGAPEVVLARSSKLADQAGVVPIDRQLRARLMQDAEELADEGLRALAFGYRELQSRPDDPIEAEEDLVFLGIIGLSDEIRSEVPASVAMARAAGVRTVMVTGDHLITAQSVASAIGIEGRSMHGEDLRQMEDDDLARVIAEYSIFARVDPVDKVKIVKAWRQAGATVAMTGDGVNDAPALHTADIGVAMGSGTDVSREASALVLADDNYATIVSAIAEGRRIFHNLRNVVHYLLSANASEVIYMMVGFTFFGFLGEPLIAVQLLWINLLSDALPALALGMDLPRRDLMSDPPGLGRDILSGRNVALLIAQGVILAGASVAVLVGGHYLLLLGYPAVRTMVFTTLVLAQLIHAINVRTEGDDPLAMPQPALLAALGLSAALQLGIIYSRLGNEIFRTVPLSGEAMAWVVGAAVLSMAVVRILKQAMSRIGR